MLPDSLCAIVLAAGLGTRYRAAGGADKLLALSHRQQTDSLPVLLATLQALGDAADACVIVVREEHHALIDCLHAAGHAPLQVRSDGLGHSLAQAVAQQRHHRGWLVVLGDMPYVQPDTYRAVAAATRAESLIVPTCDGRRGHPRGIGVAFADHLLALHDERGAQALFGSAAVRELAVDDPGILRDIDRPDDRLA